MGLMAPSCRFSPSTDSLKACLPDRLRHSLFHFVHSLPCPREKVKCFSVKEFFELPPVFVQHGKYDFFKGKQLTKPGVYA
jgi:hypothetical protein